MCNSSTSPSPSPAYSLNRELLQDAYDSSIAFSEVDVSQGLVPAITLFAGERASMNFGLSEEPLSCSFVGSGFQPVCNPMSLHYNIPLWYSAPGDYDVIDSTHPRLYEKRVSGGDQISTIEVYSRVVDTSKQECLRLNFGVTVSCDEDELDQCPSSSPRRHLFLPSSAKENVSFYGFTNGPPPRESDRQAVAYSVVIPTGQDPEGVFVGWTTAGFRYIHSQFQSDKEAHSPDSQYGQQVKVAKHTSQVGLECESTYSTAFMVCLADLLPSSVQPRLSGTVK